MAPSCALIVLLGLSAASEVPDLDEYTVLEDSVWRQLLGNENDTSTTTDTATTTTQTATTTMTETTMAPGTTRQGAGDTGDDSNTTTTMAGNQQVRLSMTISGADYQALQNNPAIKEQVIDAIDAGIVQELNSRLEGNPLTKSNVETTLRSSARRLRDTRALQNAGGVVAESVITLPASAPASVTATSVASVVTSAAANVESTVLAKIQAVSNIGTVTLSGQTLAVSGANAVVLTESPTTTTQMRGDISGASREQPQKVFLAATTAVFAVLSLVIA